jgi:hypothetical protein
MSAPEPDPGATCPRCGAPLHADQDWCLECGAAARTRIAPTPNWRGPVIALAVVAAAVVAAPPASAKPQCSAPPPNVPWHSCLRASDTALDNGHVMLTRATPVLVVRLSNGCSAHLAKRKVILRTAKGKRLAKGKVKGTCHGTVARFRGVLRPDVELPSGTVIRSFWSGIPDKDEGPKVKLS